VKNANLQLVKIRSSLKEVSDWNVAFEEVKHLLKQLGDISALEDCPSIILHICELIENISKPTLKGQEKQELAIKLLHDLYPSLVDSKTTERLKKTINFLVDMKLVNRIPNTTIAVKNVCGFLAKQLK
jgi:hypothetical protein